MHLNQSHRFPLDPTGSEPDGPRTGSHRFPPPLRGGTGSSAGNQSHNTDNNSKKTGTPSPACAPADGRNSRQWSDTNISECPECASRRLVQGAFWDRSDVHCWQCGWRARPPLIHYAGEPSEDQPLDRRSSDGHKHAGQRPHANQMSTVSDPGCAPVPPQETPHSDLLEHGLEQPQHPTSTEPSRVQEIPPTGQDRTPVSPKFRTKSFEGSSRCDVRVSPAGGVMYG
jgi:hypothetical protein